MQTLPDPRRRQGRRYPRAALLGMLILAARHGDTSLRGRWRHPKGTRRQHWHEVWWPLGCGSPHFPALTTSRNLLGALDAAAVDLLVSDWLRDLVGPPVGGISADGKVLRGSRRAEVPGVWLVALARHDLGSVVHQRQVVPGSHERPTLLALLRAVPLEGQIVTRDAGLVCADTTQVVRAQQGDYLGVLKGNQADIKAAVDDWISEQILSPSAGPTRRTHHGEVTRATRNAGIVAGAGRRSWSVSGSCLAVAGRSTTWVGPPPPASPTRCPMDGGTGHRRDESGPWRRVTGGHPAPGTAAVGDGEPRA